MFFYGPAKKHVRQTLVSGPPVETTASAELFCRT